MNILKATISHIEQYDILHIATFNIGKKKISMLSLELNDDMKIGAKVLLQIKSTNIIILKQYDDNISCDNQIDAVIMSIEFGKLLSSIKVDIDGTILEAIITTKMAKQMELKSKDNIVLLLPDSQISIYKVLDD